MSGGAARLAPCGIRHVDMAAPFAPIPGERGERAVYAVFWRNGRPVGSQILLAGELPVPAAAVPALAANAAAEAVLAGAALEPGAAPARSADVSVVICTRDRAGDLARCLSSLARCSPAPREVLVVDNAPTSDAGEAVARAFPNARYVIEPQPGLSNARNTGVWAARCDIIAFTDDDVEVATDWIARLAAPFDDPAVACVTGSVLPADLSGEAACLFEFELGGLCRHFEPRRYDERYLVRPWWRSPRVWDIGAGANMAVRRQAFAECGLFDPRLGAGASGCSEDSEFWFRLLRAGRICHYDPSAVVFHHHRPDRKALARQLRAYARGHVVSLFVQFRQDRHPGHLVRAAVEMPWYYLKLAQRAARRLDGDTFSVILPQLRGCLEGPFHALRWLRRAGPPPLGPSGERA